MGISRAIGRGLAVCGCLALAVPGAAGELDELLQPAAQEGSTPTVAAARRGEVMRAAFTTAVVDREPQGTVTELTTEHKKVYYFTELSNLTGHRIVHRWEYRGKVMAEIPFVVGGPRWRVYSAKSLLASWTGEWTASTVDEDGRILALNTLEYKP